MSVTAKLGFLIVCISLGACSRPLQVKSKGSNSTNSFENEFTSDGKGGPVLDQLCQGQFPVTLRIVEPSGRSPVVGESVRFEVTATGCTGYYRAEGAEGVFRARYYYSKSFASAGAQVERITLQSIDDTGNVVGSTSGETRFDVLASGGPASGRATSVPVSAPTCTLARTGSWDNSSTVNFTIAIAGAATTAGIIDGMGTAIDALAGIPVIAALRGTDGKYHAYGRVINAGGESLCEAHFQPPTCTLSAQVVDSTTVDFTLWVVAGLERAFLNNEAVALPIGSATYRRTVAVGTTAGSATVESALGPLGRDVARCSTTYALPPTVIGTVVSYMSDATSAIALTANEIIISTGDWYPVSDVQIMALMSDGTRTILATWKKPFGPIDIPHSPRTVTFAGNFAPYLIGMANPHPVTLRTSTFASETRMSTGTAIAAGSNRNGVRGLSFENSILRYEAKDTSWGAAYYQVAICRQGYTCPL